MPEVANQQSLTKLVEDLAAREQIRTCYYRINRGIDRIDADLLGSGFFPDARIRWGTPETVDFETWLRTALTIQKKTQRTQHLVGNILIDLRGDEADVEAYEIARHLTPMGEEMKDLILASRYVDKFALRNGDWRIVHREKVLDWVRIMEGSDPAYDMVPGKGRRDDEDVSFNLFGKDAFHSLI
ncbi:nuclear transport factor 2 family protein [Sphingobium sp.]|uniref:nuclear transport factor 2 family protein n=1 Tax=Sphingobium sp. TaxID=1912891 RepID=UPI0028BDDC63|nr:nuclear transport factor 2 family protein [Sphingobium sp.]